MAKVKKALTKAATDNKKKKNRAKTPSLTKKSTAKESRANEKKKQADDEVAVSIAKRKHRTNGDDENEDNEEVVSIDLDTESLVAEVELSEGKQDEDDDSMPLPSIAAVEEDSADADNTILPTMEGMSILRETELNDVIAEVKRRSESNGGYVTYEELNQILPSNIVDAIQSDKYLKLLEALSVQVIREEDVKKYLDANPIKY